MFKVTLETPSSDTLMLRRAMAKTTKRDDRRSQDPRQISRNQRPNPFENLPDSPPLYLTFHSGSFAGLPDRELHAVALLRGLCVMDEIESFDTDSSDTMSVLTVQPAKRVDGVESMRVGIDYPDGRKASTTAIAPWVAKSLQEAAAEVEDGRSSEADATRLALVGYLPLAHAHAAVGDILVTGSHVLLSHRNHPYITKTNPLLPSEAARLVGVFLRSRGRYVYGVGGDWPRSFPMNCDRQLFYEVVAEGYLPAMWRYRSACAQASTERQDDTYYLAGSIITGVARALRARDAIGREFYLAQNDDTREAMMYHLDYMLLLLGGVFDTQARIAMRAYGIEGNERTASFSKRANKGFVGQLVGSLADFVGDPANQSFINLVLALRHTIHGAKLPAFGVAFRDQYGRVDRQGASRIGIPHDQISTIKEVRQLNPMPDAWGSEDWFETDGGRKRFLGTLVEPYTFASAVLDKSMDLADRMLSATDLQGLLPPGVQPNDWPGRPPADDDFHNPERWGQLSLLA